MYGRWVPGMSGDLYCHQLAPRQRHRDPPLAGNPHNPAMTPAPHRVVQAIVTLSLWWKIKEWEGARKMKTNNALLRKN